MKPRQRLELPRQGCLPQTSPSNPPLTLTTTRTATATWNLPLMQLSAGSCWTIAVSFIVLPMLSSAKAEVLCCLMLSERSLLRCCCVQVDQVKLWPIYWHHSLCKLGVTVAVLSCHSQLQHIMFTNDVSILAQFLPRGTATIRSCMLLAGQSWTRMGLITTMA